MPYGAIMEVHGETARDRATRFLVDYIVEQSELKQSIIEADQREIRKLKDEGRVLRRSNRMRASNHPYKEVPWTQRPCFRQVCKNKRAEDNVWCNDCRKFCTFVRVPGYDKE